MFEPAIFARLFGLRDYSRILNYWNARLQLRISI